MAIIKCKECNADISSTVNKCPSCGKDQRNWFMKHKILTVILIFVVLSVIGGALNGSKEPPIVTSNGTSSEPTEVVAKVGDKIKMDGFEITILSIEQKSKVGSEFLNAKPSEGGTYIVVNWKYKNITDKPINAFSVPNINLLDKNKTQYEKDISASIYYSTEKKINAKILSELNPGITVNDAQVYEVAKDLYKVKGWRLQIKADTEAFINIK